jgi:hypothetical protein
MERRIKTTITICKDEIPQEGVSFVMYEDGDIECNCKVTATNYDYTKDGDLEHCHALQKPIGLISKGKDFFSKVIMSLNNG